MFFSSLLRRLFSSRLGSGLLPGELSPSDMVRQISQQIQPARTSNSASSSWLRSSAQFALLIIRLHRSDHGLALARHVQAELALTQIRGFLANTIREGDYFAILGQEEIAVVLQNVHTEAIASLAMHRIVQALGAPILVEQQPVYIHPAIGCAFFPDHGNTIEELFTAADLASNKARKQKTPFAFYQKSHTDNVYALLTQVRSALLSNQIEVWFQPQIDLKANECLSAEALVRWPHAADETISPLLIADIAEDNGLISNLTTFVLNTALRYLAELKKKGILLRIAVNTSASMLPDQDLPAVIARALDTWGIAPEALTIEITESRIMQDVERSLEVMRNIKALGVQLSIDDFGTGYSSFAYLSQMPADELKIDKQFVQNLLSSNGDLQIVRSVINLAHNLQLKSVGEGVEDLATFNTLKELGCDLVQGYLYAKPMLLTDLVAWWPTRGVACAPHDESGRLFP